MRSKPCLCIVRDRLQVTEYPDLVCPQCMKKTAHAMMHVTSAGAAMVRNRHVTCACDYIVIIVRRSPHPASSCRTLRTAVPAVHRVAPQAVQMLSACSAGMLQSICDLIMSSLVLSKPAHPGPKPAATGLLVGDDISGNRRTADITTILNFLAGNCIAFTIDLMGVTVVAAMLRKADAPMLKRSLVAPALLQTARLTPLATSAQLTQQHRPSASRRAQLACCSSTILQNHVHREQKAGQCAGCTLPDTAGV
jgi:hypothetical protein